MKTVMIMVAVVFVASTFYGLGYRGIKMIGEKKTAIATVNGNEVDKTRFNSNLQRLINGFPGRKTIQEIAYLQMLALNQVIDYTLMLSEAKRHERVSGGEVDAAIAQIMQANNIPTKAQFEEALKRNAFTMGDFKRMVKEDILIQKMIGRVRGAVALNPEDLREVKASHILIAIKTPPVTSEAEKKILEAQADVAAKTLVQDILSRIKKGESFSALAGKYSDDPGSKDKGGDLGYFTTGAMVPEFEKVAFALKPGEVSDVVKTPFGYHIIKLTDIRLRQLDEKDKGKDIKEVVLLDKQEKANNQWMFSLKSKSKVEIVNPVLKAYDARLRGQIDNAIALYNQAMSENPNDPYLHVLLGDTYDGRGDLQMAIAEYLKAASLSPSDPDLCLILGKAYEKAKTAKIDPTKDYRKLALEQFSKASLLAAENIDLHKELADIYKGLGEFSLKYAEEQKIVQIEAKLKFEEEIKKKAGEQQPK
jgi:foldase protein PrsA